MTEEPQLSPFFKVGWYKWPSVYRWSIRNKNQHFPFLYIESLYQTTVQQNWYFSDLKKKKKENYISVKYLQ